MWRIFQYHVLQLLKTSSSLSNLVQQLFFWRSITWLSYEKKFGGSLLHSLVSVTCAVPLNNDFYLTIRLWARDFYEAIVDSALGRINYRVIEMESE